MTPSQRVRAMNQFQRVIMSDLHRWFLESDLDAEDLAKATIRALDAWMDQEILDIDFEPEDED